MKTMETVRFNNRSDRSFFVTVSKRTQEYLKSTGQSAFANWKWWAKITVILGMMAGSYALMLSQVVPGIAFFMGMMVIFTFTGLLLGFNVAHDASHNALFRNKKYNYWFLRAFDFIGISGYLWTIKHVRSHHKYTNIAGFDADIAQQKLIRLSPLTPILPHHKFQVLYAPLIYGNFTLFLVYAKDFMMLFSSEIGGEKNLKHPIGEVLLVIASKLFYTFYALIVPILVLDISAGWVIFGFWVSHMVASFFAMMILLPVHLVDETVFPETDDQDMLSKNWPNHQVDCTSDFAVNSPIVAWLAGGLNLHLVHHLCPTICHIHYGPMTRIIREAAIEHGLPYKSNSWAGAIASHWRFLRKMSREENPYEAEVSVRKAA